MILMQSNVLNVGLPAAWHSSRLSGNSGHYSESGRPTFLDSLFGKIHEISSDPMIIIINPINYIMTICPNISRCRKLQKVNTYSHLQWETNRIKN